MPSARLHAAGSKAPLRHMLRIANARGSCCRFQYFQDNYNAKVKEAKQTGIFDNGVTSLSGSSVREVDNRLIHVEKATGMPPNPPAEYPAATSPYREAECCAWLLLRSRTAYAPTRAPPLLAARLGAPYLQEDGSADAARAGVSGSSPGSAQPVHAATPCQSSVKGLDGLAVDARSQMRRRTT